MVFTIMPLTHVSVAYADEKTIPKEEYRILQKMVDTWEIRRDINVTLTWPASTFISSACAITYY